MKVSVVEEEDVQRHQKGKGLTPLHPVLLDQDNDIMINDIKRIVEKASTFQNSSKSLKQIKEELQEVDEIVQEFMEGKNLHRNENEHDKPNWEVGNLEENNRSRFHIKEIHRCPTSLLSIRARDTCNTRGPPEMGRQITRIPHTCGNRP